MQILMEVADKLFIPLVQPITRCFWGYIQIFEVSTIFVWDYPDQHYRQLEIAHWIRFFLQTSCNIK